MTDATILIPTFRHPTLVPYALRSALAQEGAEVDVLVVGDGVQDDTRVALEPFLADRRVTFFDNPKGERHGERHRHEALQYASGRIVCYLSDDDLLLGDHVAEMGASSRTPTSRIAHRSSWSMTNRWRLPRSTSPSAASGHFSQRVAGTRSC